MMSTTETMVSRFHSHTIAPVEKTNKAYTMDYLHVLECCGKIDNGKILSEWDRVRLLECVSVSYHDGRKIKEIYSIDSSALFCDFCKAMQKAAENNPDHICGHCYAVAMNKLYSNTKLRHSLQAFILSNFAFTIHEMQQGLYIPYGAIVRFNSDGDIQNDIMAYNYLTIAKAFPDNNFTLWAKNIRPVQRVIDETGKPGNIRIIYSNPIIDNPVAVYPIVKRVNPCIDFVFSVYKPSTIEKMIYSENSGECNGKKCMACMRCYVPSRQWKDGCNICEKLR